MSEAEQLSALIGSIYDTTLDSSRWPGVLEKVTTFMNGKASVLGMHNAAVRTGNAFFSWGDDPEHTQRYFEQYIKINPTVVPLNLHVKAGEVFSFSTVMPYEEFCRSRMYIEWAKPQGYGDFTHVLVEKSATSFAHFGTAHGLQESPANDNARHRMRLLAPHVCRAVAIAKIIDLNKVEAAMLADAVDGVAAGVFLVRADGGIAYANASARWLLGEKNALREADGVLTVFDPAAREALGGAFAAAVSGDIALGRRGLAVPLVARDGERYVAHVLSLTAGARRQAGNNYAAVAAVFVHKAALQRPTLIEAVAKHFQLTPSELRVLFAIVEVRGVPEVAAVLGISEETVKTHLKHVFAKTDTNRQADLVKLIAGYANPLV
jgi:DNA-binding CsgD family transcriptional regulator/PAS domain-containing protein